MSKSLLARININTILTTVVGGLVVLGISKADKAFTTITRLEDQQDELVRQQQEISHRVERIENALGIITNGHKP